MGRFKVLSHYCELAHKQSVRSSGDTPTALAASLLMPPPRPSHPDRTGWLGLQWVALPLRETRFRWLRRQAQFLRRFR